MRILFHIPVNIRADHSLRVERLSMEKAQIDYSKYSSISS
uniref:Uncharacterized protein n=1 Tax=Rhizophora mucronata TaxID=61149 RepID=A0A2P2NKM3_RHIMU